MREITIKVYKYNELKPAIKEKVLNYFRDREDLDSLDLTDYLTEYAKELVEQAGITPCDNLTLCYSLGYSQGDGLQINGNFDFKRGRGSYFACVKHSGYYNHSEAVNISISCYDDVYSEAPEKVQIWFKNIYRDICKKLEKLGYAYIEYYNSERHIKEEIEINDYEFEEDGRLI